MTWDWLKSSTAVTVASGLLLIVMASSLFRLDWDMDLQPRQVQAFTRVPAELEWVSVDGKGYDLRVKIKVPDKLNPQNCDKRARITRYWDVGGQLVLANSYRAENAPDGAWYPFGSAKPGSVAEIYFSEDEVPVNVREYVTVATAPDGACGPDGFSGTEEVARKTVPPRPDIHLGNR